MPSWVRFIEHYSNKQITVNSDQITSIRDGQIDFDNVGHISLSDGQKLIVKRTHILVEDSYGDIRQYII